jgi:hypothetical protein
MKNHIFSLIILILVPLFFFNQTAQAQNINWQSLQEEQKHLAFANFGLEYGVVWGVGYGYQLNTKMPIVLNAEYSFPSGNNLLDDFKTKIGGQIRLLKIYDFQFTAKVYSIFRRYQNDMVRMVNFGSDFSGIIGYYRSKWFVAGEFGFDKAISTHFKHSTEYKNNFPEVKDGWYEPPTGGNVYYGLQAGYSFPQHDIHIKIGQIIVEDFKMKPTLPFYLQMGYNIKF